MRCRWIEDSKIGRVHIPRCWGAAINGPGSCICHKGTAKVSHTDERIETVELLKKLSRCDEKPGQTILRALRYQDALKEIIKMHPDPRQQANIIATKALYVDDMSDKEAAIKRGLNAINTKFSRDMAFANAGFTLSVIDAIVTAILSDR